MLLVTAGVAAENRPAIAGGLAGNALQFDGGIDEVGDFVRVPGDTSLTLQSYTLEAWVFILDSPEFLRRPFISKGPDFGNYTLGVLGDGRPEYVHQTSTGNYSCCAAASLVPLGEWTHIAVSHHGGTTEIYQNGKLNGSASLAPPQQLNMFDLVFGAAGGANSPVFGPGNGSDWSDFHRGLLDEVRIWDVARTGQEIAENYNRIVNTDAPGLLGYWNFDEALDDQNVFDLASLGGHSNGTLGSDIFASADDPARVDSTVPLVLDLADCPVDNGGLAQIFADAGASVTDSYLVAYVPGTTDSGFQNNSGPALCAGPFFPGDGTDPTVGFIQRCSSISTEPGACFPTDPALAREALGMHTEHRINVAGSSCTIHCETVQGTRSCTEICVTESPE